MNYRNDIRSLIRPICAVTLLFTACTPAAHDVGDGSQSNDFADSTNSTDTETVRDDATSLDTSPAETDQDFARLPRRPAVLPERSGESDCALQPTTLEVCDWVALPDAIVLGVVSELRAFDTPMVSASEGSEASTCPSGVVEKGLEMELFVDAASDASLVGSTLKVRVGPRVSLSWSPAPRYTDANEIDFWSGQSEGVRVGDLLGFSLFDSGEGFHTLGRLPLFTVGDAGVEIQDVEFCATLFPESLVGASYDDVVATFHDCPTTESTEQGMEERELLALDPAMGGSAVCY